MKSSFSISTKIWFSIGILIMSYFASMVFGFILGGDIELRLKNISSFLFEADKKSQLALTAYNEQIKLYEDAVMSGEEIFFESAQDNAIKAQNAILDIINLKDLDEKKRTELKMLLILLKEYTVAALDIYASMNEVFNGHEDDESIYQLDELELYINERAGQLALQSESLREKLSSNSKAFANELKSELSTISYVTRHQRYLNMILFFAVVIITLSLISIIITKSITTPLKKTIMLENAVEQSVDGIVVNDYDGNIFFVNRAWAHMHGYETEEIIGKNISYFHTQEQLEKEVFSFIELAKEKGSNMGEIWHKKRDETLFPTMTTANLLEDGSKKSIPKIVAIARDITLQKRNEEELKAAKESAEDYSKALKESLEVLQKTQNQLVQAEKMASLGGLVAGVAHEINTPVGIGVTAASFLERKTRETEELVSTGKLKKSDLMKYMETAKDSSKSILSNLSRAAELIQSFKQVAVDQTNEEKRIFVLKDYLDEVLLSLKPKYKRTKHSIIVNCSEDIRINSCPGAFMQIITNLVMNSLVHGFENIEQGNIEINFIEEPEELIMNYIDNGKGMDKEQIKKIFDPFFTTKRGKGGTGLGMHIVFNLITQTLGGQIDCQSSPNEGTQFVMKIPIKKDNNQKI